MATYTAISAYIGRLVLKQSAATYSLKETLEDHTIGLDHAQQMKDPSK